MNKNLLYTEAFRYMALGFSIIPCGKDKRPRLSSWKKYQTIPATEDEILAWWEKWPEANVGIVTGKISGILVIDVDTYKGGDPRPFPITYTVKTGNGGLQLYYKYTEGFSISANAYEKYPHVDIRSDGGFVIAPPSRIIPKTKEGIARDGLYEIINNLEFAEFPAHLFPEKRRRTAKSLVGVLDGKRNDSMASLIGKLLYTMDPERFSKDAWPWVVAINKTYKPPLTDEVLKRTFESIAKIETKRKEDLVSPIQLDSETRIELQLRKSKTGAVYKDMTNCYITLMRHPDLNEKIKYNSFRHEIEYNGRPLHEEGLLKIQGLIQDNVLPNVGKNIVYDAVYKYADDNKYDEAIDWLETLKWDNKPRLADWLIQITKIEDTPYNRGVGAQWFLGLMNRLVHPGCVFDYVLTLVGPQDIGKTTLFRELAGQWYKSYMGALDNKDFYLILRGGIIVDLDEGVAMYKNESIKIKSIITQTFDEFRAPYDRLTQKIPRRFVFSMTTNDNEPLRDVTGNRRYWLVDVKEKFNFNWVKENRDQLFAEAYYVIKNKKEDEYPKVPTDIALKIQDEHLAQDEWTDTVADHIRKSVDYCEGSDNYQTTVMEIYKEALGGISADRLQRKDEMRIGNILRKELGLEKRRIAVYGVQKNRYVITKEMKEKLRGNPEKQTTDDF